MRPWPTRFLLALLLAVSGLVAVGDPARAALSMSWVRTIGGPGHAGLYGWGAGTMSDGSVLISDYWNFRVQRFSQDGQLLGTVIPDDGNHEAPYDIAVDRRTDTIYVADGGAGTIRVFSPFGTQGTGDGQFEFPMGLASLEEGRILVLDAGGERIQEVAIEE